MAAKHFVAREVGFDVKRRFVILQWKCQLKGMSIVHFTFDQALYDFLSLRRNQKNTTKKSSQIEKLVLYGAFL